MSDELQLLGTGAAGGGAVAAVVAWLLNRVVHRGDEAVKEKEADLYARVVLLESKIDVLEKVVLTLPTNERVERALGDHRERLSHLELRLENVDTRLSSREGMHGKQHTGVTHLSDEMLSALNKLVEND